VLVIAFLLLTMTLILFYYSFFIWLGNRPGKRRRERLQAVIQNGMTEPSAEEDTVARKTARPRFDWRERLTERLRNLTLFQKREDRLANLLRSSGVQLTPQEFLLLCAGLLLAPMLFGVLVGRLDLGMLCGVLGLISPFGYMKWKIRSRRLAFERQLNDMLAIMSNSLKSGYSFLQATQMIATDMAEPISGEFERMLREIRMGIPTEEALQNLSARVASRDFDLIVTAIIIQRQIGGNLAEILDSIADTIRERVRIQGEIKALTAQGRFSAMIFIILPLGVGALLYTINPGYVGQLFQHPLGWVMIFFAIVGQVIGGLVIRKIITIEV